MNKSKHQTRTAKLSKEQINDLCVKEAALSSFHFLNTCSEASTKLSNSHSNGFESRKSSAETGEGSKSIAGTYIGTKTTSTNVDSQKDQAIYTLFSSQMSKKRRYVDVEEDDLDFQNKLNAFEEKYEQTGGNIQEAEASYH